VPAVQAGAGQRTVATGAPSNLAAMLMEIAKDKDVDAAKARAMFDLYKDVTAHDAKIAFTKAFIALQKILPTIDRDGKIQHADTKNDGRQRQKSTYSTYPNLMKVIKPLLDANGFGLGSWIAPGDGGKMDVFTQLDHDAGHFRVSSFPVQAETSGSKNNMQGWGSAESYAMRYNAIALLNIVSRAPQDHDKDGYGGNLQRERDGGFVEVENPPATLSKGQAEVLRATMESCGVPEYKLLQHYEIKRLEDLPFDMLEPAKKQCADYQANQAAAREAMKRNG
jgi:hypothetical protein